MGVFSAVEIQAAQEAKEKAGVDANKIAMVAGGAAVAAGVGYYLMQTVPLQPLRILTLALSIIGLFDERTSRVS